MGRTLRIAGFPCYLSSVEAAKFLENYTGKGTISELKIKQSNRKKPNPKAYAEVQFTTTEKAELMFSIIDGNLKYELSELKAWKMEHDIVHKPGTSMLSFQAIAVYFGCQTSHQRFHVFEEVAEVVVNFEFGLRKIQLLFTYCDVEYRLEISYDSIWQIHEHRPWTHATKFLVLQLFGAPRIYEKGSCGQLYEFANYSKMTPDVQWVRTTDFTASICITQSSALCLELQQSCILNRVRECFHHYKDCSRSAFSPEYGSTFSQSLFLGPTISPPSGAELPFCILFKVNSLVQNGCLAGPTLDASFFRLVDPRYFSLAFIEYALEKLYNLKECCYEPVRWLSEQYRVLSATKKTCVQPAILLDDGLVYIRRVQVTPTRVYYCGPEANISNRVLRHFHEFFDNFIRVSFVDEDGEKLWSTDLSPRASTAENKHKQHSALYDRILSTLRKGIVIADKKFEFLAFSSSQLRENSVWMFASSGGVTARSIREWLGDFRQIRNVAKYAARLGQSFGSSTETSTVATHEIDIIPDVEIQRNGNKYVFSDGIGRISSEFAVEIAKKCAITGSIPSAYQIRYAGYKGVVAVDPKAVKKLSLRNSMLKYASQNKTLDVLAWSKFHPCFLNRQIITLLSTLGVKDEIFEKKQREGIIQLDLILTDPVKAYEVLEVMGPQEKVNVLKEMLLCGYMPNLEPFLSSMLQTFRGLKLMEMRKKSRIFVPQGRLMMGCLDETRMLEYGEVFVQISSKNRWLFDQNVPFTICDNTSGQSTFICEGKVVVAKNPCLYPGDILVLQAVNVPALYHMVDCIVFPQKGFRPHPNECSGSDLDGDMYFVSWDPELIPPRIVPPMDYSPAPSVPLEHEVRIEELKEYFANYIVNDSLGIIANAHVAFADKEPNMAESQPCIDLAKLFSVAVDFPKTGVPAVIPNHLHVKEYPDFMEKFDKLTYESHRVIGKLFREVRDIAPGASCIRSFSKEVASRSYDPEMEINGFENFLDDAQYYKGEYDFKLGNLMDYYDIITEAEILCGGIMKLNKSINSKKDVEAIGSAVGSLIKEARSWFDERAPSSGTEDDSTLAKASAWYHVTYHPDYWGCYNEGLNRNHFLSFPWCIYEELIRIKRINSRRHSDQSRWQN